MYWKFIYRWWYTAQASVMYVCADNEKDANKEFDSHFGYEDVDIVSCSEISKEDMLKEMVKGYKGDNVDKKLYPVFEVDTTTGEYNMEYCLIGANNLEDLIQHLPDILKEYRNASKKEIRKLMKNYKIFPPKPVVGTYTNKPYSVLTMFGYME